MLTSVKPSDVVIGISTILFIFRLQLNLYHNDFLKSN